MFKPSDILNSACAGLNQHIKYGASVRRQKYGNKKVTIDNILFDSKKEAGRYLELRMQERCGLITDLKLQVVFELKVEGEKVCKYICDFQYMKDGKMIVEDVKSKHTRTLRVYRLKKKLMLAVYGINIIEISNK